MHMVCNVLQNEIYNRMYRLIKTIISMSAVTGSRERK